MSLIQEALKRQIEEQEKEGPRLADPPSAILPEPPVTETIPVRAASASTGSIPPPAVEAAANLPQPAGPLPAPAGPVLPPPPPPRRGPPARPGLKIAVLTTGLVIILVVGGMLALKHILKFRAVLANRPLTTAVLPAVLPAPPPPVPVKPEPPAIPGPTNAGPPENPPALPLPEPVVTVSNLAPVMLPETPPEDEALTNQPVLPAKVPAVVQTPPANPAPVAWPALKVTGVLASHKPSEGAARINNQMVFVGGEINGVLLAEIRADGVVLRYKGETKFLKIGGTLY